MNESKCVRTFIMHKIAFCVLNIVNYSLRRFSFQCLLTGLEDLAIYEGK